MRFVAYTCLLILRSYALSWSFATFSAGSYSSLHGSPPLSTENRQKSSFASKRLYPESCLKHENFWTKSPSHNFYPPFCNFRTGARLTATLVPTNKMYAPSNPTWWTQQANQLLFTFSNRCLVAVWHSTLIMPRRCMGCAAISLVSWRYLFYNMNGSMMLSSGYKCSQMLPAISADEGLACPK